MYEDDTGIFTIGLKQYLHSIQTMLVIHKILLGDKPQLPQNLDYIILIKKQETS